MLDRDSRGNVFVMATPWLRVTLTEDDEVRINVVAETGKVYRGPQFSAEDIYAVSRALDMVAVARVMRPVKQPWVLHGSR